MLHDPKTLTIWMHTASNPSSYDDERDAAVEAAYRAARIIRGRMGQIDPDAVREKDTNDLVTQTDEAAQRAIVQMLSDAFPGHEILAEEGVESEDVDRAADGFRWIVDPLDGTTNFIYNVPPVAVSVALQREIDIVVGVVLDVSNRELFTAVRGRGVRVNGHPAQVSSTQHLEQGLIATGFPYRRFEHADRYLEVLGAFMRRTRGVRRHGSAAIDLARLAVGRFTGFFETGLSPWDVAAGTLLVEEGGGRVTDYRDQPPPHPLFDRQVLASNGAIHDGMLSIVQSMRDVRL